MKTRFFPAVLFSLGILAPLSPQASTIQLPKTGMTTCYDAAGTAITCTGTRQDGELQLGVAWPAQRFNNHGDGTVTDNLTGLTWTRDARTPGPSQCNPGGNKTWSSALSHVACLNSYVYLGSATWRMPNINEIRSLVDVTRSYPSLTSGHPFTNVNVMASSSNHFWSSTTLSGSPGYAFDIYMENGTLDYTNKDDALPVWPVRDGSTPGTVQLARTGQTTCYDPASLQTTACTGTGQDGELLKGAVWHNPRFTNNGTTMTDNLTGLMWPSSDTISSAPAACTFYMKLTWDDTFSKIACFNSQNYLGYNDWRLPNFNEMSSLFNREESSPASWLTSSQGFQSFFADGYWTSTTHVNDPLLSSARAVSMYDGTDFAWPKSSSPAFGLYFVPVRAGNYTPSSLLTLLFSGAGSGDVNSNPAGINCSSSDLSCQPALFANGSTVILTATPSLSGFGGWSGCDSVNGTACTVNINAPRTVTATFTTLPPRVINPRLSTTQGYQTLQSAFNAAITADTLKALATTSQTDFIENLTVNGGLQNPFNITLQGGYESTFNTITGTTTLQGQVTIQTGSLTVDNIAIR